MCVGRPAMVWKCALQLVQSNGTVPSAYCAQATTSILKKVQGFEGIRTGFYPLKLMEQIEARPGVRTTNYFENDSGNVVDGVQGLIEKKQ